MKKLLIITGLLFIGLIGEAQVYNIMSYNGQTVNTCSGTFYDSGGQSNSYAANEVFTITFCPSTPNAFVQLDFTSWNVGPGDQMEIFDGPSTASTPFGSLNANLSPVGMIIGASILNSSGCITIRWTSATSGVGWAANVSCGLPCQTFNAGLLSTNPPFYTDTNGYHYIDICPGDSITLSGAGQYLYNDSLYHQDDATSQFVWDFGNGKSDTNQTTGIRYDTIMGFNINLFMIDTIGCQSSNAFEVRVRISTTPNFNGTRAQDTVICLGESTTLFGVVNPKHWQATSSLNVAGITYLPDGSGVSYTSSLLFNTFSPNQVVTNASDIVGVCATMEHSYLGDLNITLTCPSGQSAVLKSYPGGSNTFLGEPIDNNANPIPGLGYEYCWRPIGTITMLGAAGAHNHSFTDVLGNFYASSTFIPPSTTYPPTATASPPYTILNYLPETPFSNFISCPLNGAWTITVTDNLFIDNGYIFNWGMEFNQAILPVTWGFTPDFTNGTAWDPDPTIIVTTGPNITVQPTSPGTYSYTFRATDDLGCTYDTTITIEVVDAPQVDLGNDTLLCNGSLLTLDAGNQPSGSTFQWSNGSTTQSTLVTVSGIYIVNIEQTHNGFSCVAVDTVIVTVVPFPTVDLGVDTCSSNAITLDANNPGFDYLWNTGATTQTITANTTGTYFVRVIMVQGTQCFGDDTIDVKVIDEPIFDLGSDLVICSHEEIEFNIQQNDPQITYEWMPFASLQPSILLKDLNPGNYVLVAKAIGCEPVLDSINLTVEACDLTIPNVFTPNGDGINEKFKITNIEFYDYSNIIIYNRWGTKVFSATNYQNDWDGDGLSDGVYYYVIILNDNRGTEISGTVTIITK